jgi:hypothetical protein
MGDLYRMYLRDTSILQQKHVNALKGDSDKVIQLLRKNREILPDVVLEDDNMGDYKSISLKHIKPFLFFSFLFFFLLYVASNNGVVVL